GSKPRGRRPQLPATSQGCRSGKSRDRSSQTPEPLKTEKNKTPVLRDCCAPRPCAQVSEVRPEPEPALTADRHQAKHAGVAPWLPTTDKPALWPTGYFANPPAAKL